VRITCPILKPPNPSTASLVRYSLYKLNRNGDRQYLCLTRLPFFTLLVSPWASRTFNTLINVSFAEQLSFAPEIWQ
jgi:hypothetical protein